MVDHKPISREDKTPEPIRFCGIEFRPNPHFKPGEVLPILRLYRESRFPYRVIRAEKVQP